MFLYEQRDFGLGLCAETPGYVETSVVSLLVIAIHPPASITLQWDFKEYWSNTPQCSHKSVFSFPNRPQLEHPFYLIFFFSFLKRRKIVFQGLGGKIKRKFGETFQDSLHLISFFMEQDLDANSVYGGYGKEQYHGISHRKQILSGLFFLLKATVQSRRRYICESGKMQMCKFRPFTLNTQEGETNPLIFLQEKTWVRDVSAAMTSVYMGILCTCSLGNNKCLPWW